MPEVPVGKDSHNQARSDAPVSIDEGEAAAERLAAHGSGKARPVADNTAPRDASGIAERVPLDP